MYMSVLSKNSGFMVPQLAIGFLEDAALRHGLGAAAATFCGSIGGDRVGAALRGVTVRRQDAPPRHSSPP
jgi:hypothetical protein